MRAEHAEAMRRFTQSQFGKKYNVVRVVLQAPFTLQRQYCELPLVPSLVRDACIRGLAAIQLGVAHNDRFFCVSSVRIAQMLQYVGHIKSGPVATEVELAALPPG